MVVLTQYTGGTYKSAIHGSLASGFKALYRGSSTESDLSAAKSVVAKYYGQAAAESVHRIEAAAEISRLCGSKSKGRIVFTFDEKAKAKSPLALAAQRKAKPVDGKASVVAQDDLPSLGAAITFAQNEIAEIGRKAMQEALPLRLKQGLCCLKAQALFAIEDPAKRGAMGGRPKTSSDSDQVSDEPSDTPTSFSDWLLTQPLTKGSAYDFMHAVSGLGLDHTATEKQLEIAYNQAWSEYGDALSITKLKNLAKREEEEEEEEAPAPPTAEARRGEARAQIHEFRADWSKWISTGDLDFLEPEDLREMQTFLADELDRVKRLLKSASKA